MAKRIRIVFSDTNEACVNSLVERFDRELGDKYEKDVITSKEYLEKFLMTPKSIDILIIDENMYDAASLRRMSVANVVLLSESTDTSMNGVAGENVVAKVCKYQRMKDIYDTIIAASNVNISDNDSGAKVIMMYSPIGGIGKTLCSVSLCAKLVAYKERPFFISCETSQSFSAFLNNETFAPAGAERVIKDPSRILNEGRAVIGSEQFDYLKPLECCPSAINLTGETYVSLMSAIRESGRYSHIIIDAASDFTRDTAMLMSFCDKVVVFTGQDQLAAIKVKRMMDNAVFDNRKFVFVCNKFDENQQDYSISGINDGYTISARINRFSSNVGIHDAVNSMLEQKGLTELMRIIR